MTVPVIVVGMFVIAIAIGAIVIVLQKDANPNALDEWDKKQALKFHAVCVCRHQRWEHEYVWDKDQHDWDKSCNVPDCPCGHFIAEAA